MSISSNFSRSGSLRPPPSDTRRNSLEKPLYSECVFCSYRPKNKDALFKHLREVHHTNSNRKPRPAFSSIKNGMEAREQILKLEAKTRRTPTLGTKSKTKNISLDDSEDGITVDVEVSSMYFLCFFKTSTYLYILLGFLGRLAIFCVRIGFCIFFSDPR